MMLKKFRCLALVLALILVVVSSTTFAAKNPIKLVFGHVFPADHYYNKAILDFKKMVEKNSKGRILVDVFPAGQIGSDKEMIQATSTGAQQMTFQGLSTILTQYPKSATFSLSYLYRDYKHYLKVMSKGNSLINENELTAKTGLKILAFWPRPARQLSSNRPINKIEDLKGFKIRVPQSPIFMAFWKAVGAIPTPLPMSDVYTGLATGTIDGQENPLDTIYANKLHEQQKYIALIDYPNAIMVVFVNNKCWSNLTSAQKKILKKAASKCTDMVTKMVAESDKEYSEKLRQEGVKFTKPDIAPFRERAKTIWSKFGDEKLIKKIQAIK
jgi:tripartite ATP-independent transporter DctP family solute receptor